MTLSNRARHYYQIKFRNADKPHYQTFLEEYVKTCEFKETSRHHYSHTCWPEIKIALGNYQLTIVCESESITILTAFRAAVSTFIFTSIEKSLIESKKRNEPIPDFIRNSLSNNPLRVSRGSGPTSP